MRAVGIRELKAKLSSYIAQVGKGEHIVVTDHGDEVAVFAPLSNEHRLIRRLQQAGKAQWSGGKPQGLDETITVTGRALSLTVLGERQ